MNRSTVIDSEKSLDGWLARGETPAMTTSHDEPLHLRRIDPSQNMRRFYSLSIQPTLFGEASLVRHWGRIGTNGQEKVETFDESAAATKAMAKLVGSKRRRGYHEPKAGDSR